MSTAKSIPLTKDEVRILVQLVETKPIIFSKVTNAANNQMKDQAWGALTEHFNSVIASCPRTPEQLRLKWENLKKAARKRSAKIRMNNLKTGGGKDFIPPDEILEKVAGILGPTCGGYTVNFGGDAQEVEDVVEQVTINVPFQSELDENIHPDRIEKVPQPLADKIYTIPPLSPSLPHTPRNPPRKFFFASTTSKGKLKRQAVTADVKASTIRKNEAIAAYYEAKRKQEEEIFVLKKRKLQLEILEKEKINE